MHQQPTNPYRDDNHTPKWSAYYKAVEGRPPRDTLLAALEQFEQETPTQGSRLAVDLGCGDGRDTIELLRRGWQVLGVDANPEALERLVARPDLPPQSQLQTCLAGFIEAQWPDADLVNASFSLPFCPPEEFPSVWSKIVRSLKIGGRFAGQLFGERDSWATLPQRSHHTRSQVEALLAPFEVEVFEEEEHEGKTAIGEQKYWHIFHIVARKR